MTEPQDLTHITALSTQSDSAIEALLDAAFGPGRHQRTAYAIRRGMQPVDALSFAALDDRDNMVGLLQSWPVALTDAKGKEHPLVMVGPVAVLPALQQGGIGRTLMQRLMEEAHARPCDPMVMIGDPEYYGRFFGFSAAVTGKWDVPGPVERRRLLALSVNGAPIPESGTLGPRSGLMRTAC